RLVWGRSRKHQRLQNSLSKPLMRTSVMKIQDRAFEKPLELLLMKDQKVIQAFSSHAQEKTLTHSIRLWGSIWRSKHLDATGSCHSCKIRPAFLVSIPDEVFGVCPYGIASRSCWSTHRSVGERVPF